MQTAFKPLVCTSLCVIVISNVENHEALQSGQLPTVVWAHEGSGVFDMRQVMCPRERESARILDTELYKVMAGLEDYKVQRTSGFANSQFRREVVLLSTTAIWGKEGVAIIPRLTRARSNLRLEELSQA